MKASLLVVAAAFLAALSAQELKATHKFPPEPPIPEYQFRFGNVYTKGMVLQMGPKRSQIWGFGKPFSEVVLTLRNETYSSTVNQIGQWLFKLEPQVVGGPHTILVQQYPLTVNTPLEKIELESVMFGDVWICSGGSNMAQELNNTLGAEKIIATMHASRNSNVKLMQIAREFSLEEREDVKVSREWAHAGPDDDLGDSLNLLAYQPALCLLYGMKMAELHRGRPIGLVEAAWGGTPIETWISPRVAGECRTRPSQGHFNDFNQYSNHALWNGMIAPLAKMTVRGAIWHQGEANTEYNREKYACHMTNLVSDWRSTFAEGSVKVGAENDIAFAFGVVQLGPSLSARHAAWSELRLGQMGGSPQLYLPNAKIPEGFMAAAYDLADPSDLTSETSLGVHYRDKATVAERLALASQALLYDKSLPRYGPQVIRIAYDTENWTANITYDQPIKVNGTQGFSKQIPNGDWVDTPILLPWARGVVIALNEGQGLAYGRRAAPCAYKHCSIYSDDAYRLPALVFQDQSRTRVSFT